MHARFVSVGMFATLCVAPWCHAQVSTVDVLKRTLAAVGKIEQNGGQVLFIQIDNVHKDYTKSQTYELGSGATYTIAAIGDDDRIDDIDLKVLDANGLTVAEDQDAQNIAVVALAPRRSQRFSLKVNPYAMKRGANDGFYALIVARNR